MTDKNIPPFHLAFPVDDLEAARNFYKGILGCGEGRSSNEWVDFDFFGHQIVAHLAPEEVGEAKKNSVDGHDVPCRHFGIIMSMENWQEMAGRLTAINMEFIIKPYVRFKGEAGEQATMFFSDPAGNAVELKAFKHMAQLFAK